MTPEKTQDQANLFFNFSQIYLKIPSSDIEWRLDDLHFDPTETYNLNLENQTNVDFPEEFKELTDLPSELVIHFLLRAIRKEMQSLEII